MIFSVTQNGKPLSKRSYKWNESTRSFSTNENDLVLDFSDYNSVTFKTGSYCAFITGNHCTFNTENFCTFNTGSHCTFKTGYNCIFNAQSYCTFNVYEECEFTVGDKCAIIRRDVFEIIKPKPNKKIKLKKYEVKGFWTEEELLIKEIIE